MKVLLFTLFLFFLLFFLLLLLLLHFVIRSFVPSIYLSICFFLLCSGSGTSESRLILQSQHPPPQTLFFGFSSLLYLYHTYILFYLSIYLTYSSPPTIYLSIYLLVLKVLKSCLYVLNWELVRMIGERSIYLNIDVVMYYNLTSPHININITSNIPGDI